MGDATATPERLLIQRMLNALDKYYWAVGQLCDGDMREYHHAQVAAEQYLKNPAGYDEFSPALPLNDQHEG